MTPLTKKTIVAFLFSGLIFAGLSAGFDYSDGMEFRLWRFIFKAFFFGFFMALMLRYNLKKKMKRLKTINRIIKDKSIEKT